MIIQLPWTDSLCAIQERKKKEKKKISPFLFWLIRDEPKAQEVKEWLKLLLQNCSRNAIFA